MAQTAAELEAFFIERYPDACMRSLQDAMRRVEVCGITDKVIFDCRAFLESDVLYHRDRSVPYDLDGGRVGGEIVVPS